MVDKEVLKKFLKISSNRIFAGLDSGKWEGLEKEAAITVLKNRGKDVQKYISEEKAFKPAPEEKVNELGDLINDIVEKGKAEEIEKLYALIEDVEDISSLPEETVDFYVSTIKGWRETAQVEKEVKKKSDKRKAERTRRVKEVKLSEEKQKIVDSILNNDKITKKQKILEMFEKGIERTEVLSLCFTDSTYIYDLWRVWAKERNENE